MWHIDGRIAAGALLALLVASGHGAQHRPTVHLTRAGTTTTVAPHRVAIEIRAGDRIRISGTNLATSRLVRRDADLFVTTAEGVQFRLDGFYAVLRHGATPPTLEVENPAPTATTRLAIVSPDGTRRIVEPRPGMPVQVSSGDRVYLTDRRADEARMVRRVDDLVIVTAAGREILVADYFAPTEGGPARGAGTGLRNAHGDRAD